MRAISVALVLLATPLLSACGDGGGGALRIDLETFSFDGALPGGLRLRRMGRALEAHEAYDLVPVPGGRRGEYQAEDAPDGTYVVEGPASWWMLHEGGMPPIVARDRQPPLLSMGRAHTLYLVSRTPEVRPSRVWAAERIGADGGREPVPIVVEADERGYVIALRLASEAWHGTLEVVGRVAVGPPPTPPAGADAPLAEWVRFQTSADGSPLVARVRQVPSEPLRVILVAASEAVESDGLRVEATVEGSPVSSVREAWARDGVAWLRDVPLVDRRLRVEVEGQAGAHRVVPDVRRRQVGLRLLVTGDEPTRTVRARVPSHLEVDLVQVCPQGAVAYGRVPFERTEAGIAFRAPRSRIHVLLRAGTRWTGGLAGANRNDVEGGEVPEANYVEQVAVGGVVDAAPPGTVVRFFKEIDQSGVAVLGDGFEVRVEPSGTFEARLPPGRYQVEVATRAGVWRRPAVLEARSAGARLHLPLESP